MSRQSRWLLWITVALLTAILIVWSILAPGGRMAMTVVFVGYTNAPITYDRSAVGGVSVTSTIPLAVLMATNTGAVPVKISPEVRLDISKDTSNFTPLIHPVSVGPLRPGDAILLYSLVADPQRPWWTEVAYGRYGLRTRMHDKLGTSGNPVAQAVLKRVSPLPGKQWAQSGWITNKPPLDAALGSLWGGAQVESFQPTASGSVAMYGGWVPSRRGFRAVDEPMKWFPSEPINWEPSDFIDATKPRRRYHITAPPPDWKDIDWQGINPSAPASRPRYD